MRPRLFRLTLPLHLSDIVLNPQRFFAHEIISFYIFSL